MPAPPCGNYGDVSGDGDVSSYDVLMIRQHISGHQTLTADQFIRADVNGDGVVTQADVELIYDYLMGKIDTFPVCGAQLDMETRTVSLTERPHDIQISLDGYDPLIATINVSSTGVTCTVGPCNTQGPPGVTTSGWTATIYLKTAAAASDVCSWVNSIGGWRNLQWALHVLEAYYVYIGAAGHSVGFSPVTWDDVLGLYYYLNDPIAGNEKIGCGT